MKLKQKKHLLIGTTFIGAIVLSAAVYLFFAQVAFLIKARALEAPIVAVSRESMFPKM